jgi:predicted secreted protein
MMTTDAAREPTLRRFRGPFVRGGAVTAASLRWTGVALAVLLSACAAPDIPPAPPPRPEVAHPGQRMVTVTDANDGARITLEPAQSLIVRLPVDVVAGMEWSLVDMKPGVLVAGGSRFERKLRSDSVGEAEGFTVWQMAPQGVGTVALRFDLRRPRSLQPAARTVRYDVVVK